MPKVIANEVILKAEADAMVKGARTAQREETLKEVGEWLRRQVASSGWANIHEDTVELFEHGMIPKVEGV